MSEMRTRAHLGHSAVDDHRPNDDPYVPVPPPHNDIRQAIQDRLDVLKIKEQEIVRERLELRARWNCSLAVTQLPNEILFHVFVYVSEHRKPLSEDCGVDEEDRDSSGFGLAKTGWTRLMLVCRRWCDVARATPALWRTIDVGKTSSWMKLVLILSGGATVDVSFTFDFSEEHASLLKPHCHRLRALLLPALETLEIHSNPEGMKAAPRGFYTDLGITRKRLPKPRTFQLAYTIIPPPGDSLFYARLCKLSLKACPFKASVEQFVQLLATNLCLEHLELDEFLHNLTDGGSTLGPACPLPSLLSLRLNNHPVHSARFLSRVVVPHTALLLIEARVGLPEGEQGDTLRAIVPPAPSIAISLPGLATVTWARLVVTWERYAIECHSTPPGRDEEPLLIELALTSATSAAGAVLVGWAAEGMPDGLADLIALLGAAPLTHLEVAGKCSAVEAETWARAFRALPALVSLEAEADGALFNGLRAASLAGHASADDPVACRGLGRIAVHDDWATLSRTEWVLGPLVRCLRHRAKRGTRLKELRVRFHCEHTHATRVYMAQLVDLVLNVELRYAHAFVPQRVDHPESPDEEDEEFDGEGWGGSDDSDSDSDE